MQADMYMLVLLLRGRRPKLTTMTDDVFIQLFQEQMNASHRRAHVCVVCVCFRFRVISARRHFGLRSTRVEWKGGVVTIHTPGMSVLPFPSAGNFLSSYPTFFPFLSAALTHPLIPEVTGWGRRECQPHTWFVFVEKKKNRRWENQRDKQTKEKKRDSPWGSPLDLWFTHSAFFGQKHVGPCIFLCSVHCPWLVCASLRFLMCPLSRMHIQCKNNMPFGGTLIIHHTLECSKSIWIHRDLHAAFTETHWKVLFRSSSRFNFLNRPSIIAVFVLMNVSFTIPDKKNVFIQKCLEWFY